MGVLLASEGASGMPCLVSPYANPNIHGASYPNGYSGDNCLSDLMVTGRIADAQTDINGNVNTQGQSNLNATHNSGIANLNATHNATIATANASQLTQKAVYDAESHVSDKVTQHGLGNMRSTEETGQRILGAVHNKGDRIEDRIDSADNNFNHRLDWLHQGQTNDFRFLSQGQNTLSREILETRYENSIKTLESKCDIEKQLSLVILENAKAEFRTREELLKGFAATQLDACKNTNMLQSQAAENFSKLQAQIAECCCENKLLTQSQSAETRELFLKQELAEERRCNDRNTRDNLEVTITNIVNSSLNNALSRIQAVR